jgi:hypothetical protein
MRPINGFPQMGALYNFSYDSTSNWSNLNEEFLSNYQVVVFLDTRPERTTQRDALKNTWITVAHLSVFILQDLL